MPVPTESMVPFLYLVGIGFMSRQSSQLPSVCSSKILSLSSSSSFSLWQAELQFSCLSLILSLRYHWPQASSSTSSLSLPSSSFSPSSLSSSSSSLVGASAGVPSDLSNEALSPLNFYLRWAAFFFSKALMAAYLLSQSSLPKFWKLCAQ